MLHKYSLDRALNLLPTLGPVPGEQSKTKEQRELEGKQPLQGVVVTWVVATWVVGRASALLLRGWLPGNRGGRETRQRQMTCGGKSVPGRGNSRGKSPNRERGVTVGERGQQLGQAWCSVWAHWVFLDGGGGGG